MTITSASSSFDVFSSANTPAVNATSTPNPNSIDNAKGVDETKEAFDNFVGETFFSQLISSMRKGQNKPAYFHGGRAEEVFQGQLDQMMATELTEASADQISGPMYELFQMNRGA